MHGSAAEPYLSDLARLRIRVFHDFPYLYEGSLAYEEHYLQTYFNAPESLVVLARDGERIVGASTAIPLHYEEESLIAAFRSKGMDAMDVMYFGESILLSEYRGQGAGKEFFKRRLQHAEEQGKKWAAFCAVLRSDDHPLRPSHYQPLDPFWQSQGFAKAEGMIGSLRWLDLGEKDETLKPMQFWLKEVKSLEGGDHA
ncbi:MAG: GNAT family N-acetyltransferase [Proteobacteria bacterium]|nr:MAG: GNAT family N-acetyltransferase [Pseudomonadota bacterium]